MGISLKRAFLAQNLLLVGGVTIAGALVIWRLAVLSRAVQLSPNVYAQIRTIGSVAVDAGTVQGLLSDPAANRDSIRTHLAYAIGGLEQFVTVSHGYSGTADATTSAAYAPMASAAESARKSLQDVLAPLANDAPLSAEQIETERRTVATAIEQIDDVTRSCIHFVSEHQQTASSAIAQNVSLLSALCVAAVLAAMGLSIWQYRLVMMPLQRLRQGVARLAAAQFAHQLDPITMGASPEFRDLANEFNSMARELNSFYQKLEEQVRIQSRQLVRSERLSSVGFLAAGVAHEINNPLSIISGYAELLSKHLGADRAAISDQTLEQAREQLRMIREEAFRCKEITNKLLSLSRQNSEAREALNLAGVARDVATMTHGLRHYRDRTLVLKFDDDERLEVVANLTEMKQVLLNLTINALEATSPKAGEICIEGRRNNGWVELVVKDNGRGMTPDVLQHVFDPFFTARRPHALGSGAVERGTGLGLSITHAIIERHQGNIEAESDGPGCGATFTVRLPARASGAKKPVGPEVLHA